MVVGGLLVGGGALNGGKQRAALQAVERQIRRALPPEDHWVYSDPLEEATRIRAEADAWRRACRAMVDKLADVEVREVYYTDDGKMIEKVGAELRAIARAYTDAMDRSYAMATAAVKLNLAERYNDQLERNAELFAGTAAAARACSPSTCDPSGTCK